MLVRNRFIATPGGEAAGEVVAATDPAWLGRAVAYFPGRGKYAEHTTVRVEELVPLEPGTPLDVAAALAFDGTGGGLDQLAPRGTLILHSGNPHGRVDTAHHLVTRGARAHESPETGKVPLMA